MAKLKAPLLSFGARGKIAGSLVYFPWKGIDCVREYVIPANPRSAQQIAQRTRLTDAVNLWHAYEFTDADRTGWNQYAGILAETMSGFNACVALMIASAFAAIGFHKVSDVQVNTPTGNGFDVDVENSVVGYTLRAVIGTSRTHFPTQVALVDDADGTYSLTWAGGGSDTDYYVKIEEQSGGLWYQRTGIFHVRTS